MSSLRRFVEWYLGFPRAGSGEGTAWRLESRSLGPDGWPAGLSALIAGVLAAAVVALYLKEARRLGRGRAALLAGLRLSAVGLVTVMASQVTLSIDRTGLPVVAVLIDDSASMGLPAGRTEESGGASTRLDVARGLLTREGGAFLRELSRRFRIRLYRFDGGAAEVAGGESDDTKVLSRRLDELKATGTDTRPAAAVRRVLEDLRGSSPSAIVVLTDGVSTAGEGETLSAVAPLAAGGRAPLFPVGIGGEGGAADIDLYELAADDVAFLGDPVRIVGRFRAFGFAGEDVSARLVDRATGRVLAETTVTASEDGRPAQAELTFTPEAEGEIDVTLTLGTQGREADGANNSATRRIRVRNAKARVLLADLAPRYEFRFLKAALEREATIELNTLLQQADLGFSGEDRTALERFPLRKEEVFSYDVIILGDLDPRLLGAESMEAITEFVRDRGGGLLGIAGPSFFPMRYVGTPLEPLLPVAAADVSVSAPDKVLNEGFRLRPTLAARQSGRLAELTSGRDERLGWEELPALFWRAEAPRLRPGAVTLFDAAEPDGAARPVVAFQRFGSGKVLLQLTDETWRWRFRRGDSAYGRYWMQAIRYLSRGTPVGGDQAVDLTTDRRVYGEGDAVGLRVRFRDDRLIRDGGDVRVVVEDGAGDRREVELERSGELSDTFEGDAGLLPRGSYHAWLREPATSQTPPSADFRVDPPDLELRTRAADLADLRRAAEISGGRFSTPGDAARLPRRLPAGRPVRLETSEPRALWNRPELLLMLAGVLTWEWWLRKRARLP